VKFLNYEAPHYILFASLLPLPPLRSKYSHQHSVLKHLQFMLSLGVREQVSQQHKTTDKTVVLYPLI